MTAQELMDELKKCDPNAEVKRIYGQMVICTPSMGSQKRAITEPLLSCIIDERTGNLLLFFDKLHCD